MCIFLSQMKLILLLNCNKLNDFVVLEKDTQKGNNKIAFKERKD
jgi:hypothetical protein